MRNPFAKKKVPLGLDIGKHAVKGISLKRDEDRVLLNQFFFDDSGSHIESSAAEFESRLSALIEINELENSPTCSSVSDSEVLNFSFTIPKIPDPEIPSGMTGKPINEGPVRPQTSKRPKAQS